MAFCSYDIYKNKDMNIEKRKLKNICNVHFQAEKSKDQHKKSSLSPNIVMDWVNRYTCND